MSSVRPLQEQGPASGLVAQTERADDALRQWMKEQEPLSLPAAMRRTGNMHGHKFAPTMEDPNSRSSEWNEL